MWDYGMHGWWGGWWGFFMMAGVVVLLVAAATVLAIALTRSAETPSQSSAATPSQADLLLDARFARGEIDETEYLRRRAILHGG